MTTISLGSSGTSATNPFLQALEANGLSDAKANLVGNDLVTAFEQATPDSSGSVSASDIRAKLDAQIASDVAAGKLTQSDADAVTKTLDQIQGQPSDTDAGTGATAAPADVTSASEAAITDGSDVSAGGGGGGGGGGSSKTEIGESITVSGSIKTTTITYSDGTTLIETAEATDADKQKYGKKNVEAVEAEANKQASTAKAYLSQTKPGSLFDLAA
jgi:hypothetical protein